MKKFICPVDYSDAALNAIDYAARLARHTEVELTLVQVLGERALQDIANVSSGFPPEREAREAAAEKRLQEYCKLVEDEQGIPCRTLLKTDHGNTTQALAKEIEEGGYELVVMGTNGADDLKQFYFGTHTYNTLRKVKCPMLIVPEKCSFQVPESVVYAMDYREEDVSVVRSLHRFMRPFTPRLTLLHISKRDTAISEDVFSAFKSKVEEQLEGYRGIDFRRGVEEDTADGLNSYMATHNADLLVLLTREYAFLERLFHNSITRQLSFIASYPLLVYNH